MRLSFFMLPWFLFAMALPSCSVRLSKAAQSQSHPWEAWTPGNAPSALGVALQTNFFALPLQGQSDKTPWADSFWPSNSGGISFRWNDASLTDPIAQFNYTPPSQEIALRMSPVELQKLSPAEKFDLVRGDYFYPTVFSERGLTGINRPAWEGICHGWAAAAINYLEPQPVTLENPQGISVPFGSSDIKALLTYYQGRVEQASTSRQSFFVGGRCDTDLVKFPGHANDLECRDTNAGSFHLILSNLIGHQKRSFVLDQTRDNEVWNQPAYGYLSLAVNTQGATPNSAPGTVLEVDVVTRLFFTKVVKPHWQPLNGTPDFASNSRLYRYRLELNERNEILGGEWLNVQFLPDANADRPDFVWLQGKPIFTGRFATLERLYNAATVGY